MKILMLSPHPGVPGPLPKHTPLLVDALRELRCDVRSESWGTRVAGGSWRDRLLRRPLDVLRIRMLLRRSNFDALVVKTSHDGRALLRDLALLAGTRRHVRTIVFQFHGGNSERLLQPGHLTFKLASSMLFRRADGIFVLSEEEARACRSFWSEDVFHVVVNPFLPPAVPRELGAAKVDNGEPIVLFASRVLEGKGIFDLIEAFARVRERHSCRLVVAGDGRELQAAVARVSSLGLDGSSVTFKGRVSVAELAELYRTATVFALPTYWPEGFPTAITEAMNAGLPVVTTRSRGMADHLEEGTHALFVPPRDPAALADAVDRLLADPALREAMALANRAKVEDFHPRKVGERYLRALREIERRPRHRRINRGVSTGGSARDRGA